MFDILPFPNITAKDPEERITQVIDYLYQFREELEFLLTNISTDNLSPELQARIGALKRTNTGGFTDEQTERLGQMASGGSLSVSDVMNSAAFKAHEESTKDYVKRTFEGLSFTVDYDTGVLYMIKETQE
jgi:hypothetical protein